MLISCLRPFLFLLLLLHLLFLRQLLFARGRCTLRNESSHALTTRPSSSPLLPTTNMSEPLDRAGLSCSICLEAYTEDVRRPLMLPACGHTFCRECMSGVVAREGALGNFPCPTCRRPQPVRAIEDLPVNYSLLEVARRDAPTTRAPSSSSPYDRSNLQHDDFKHGECCPEHGSRLAFWCTTCEVAACGECLFDLHPRPTHDLLRIQDQLQVLQELVRVRATRLVSQLVSAAEENMMEVRAALVVLAEHLRQRRVLDNLTRRARTTRESAKASGDFISVASAKDSIAAIQREFREAAITTTAQVWVGGPASTRLPEGPGSTEKPQTPTHDLVFTPKKHPDRPNSAPKPPLPVKPSLPAPPSLPAHVPAPPSPTTSRTSLPSPASTPLSKDSPAAPSPMPARVTPPWPPLLCGVLSGNWTSSRVTLEPRGLHVYGLRTMKDKCDLFVNMSVVSGLAPLEAPVVFLDLQEGARALGRVYITLQSRLRRAQQFLALCMGDRGPSYLGSCFHAVLRRGGAGEGLSGGDYEGKMGTGGSAILGGVEGELEVAKRCERGMVVRAGSRVETAAQFSIMVRDGPRNKTVFPFGRVCEGLGVVEEACRRPALSVSVGDCGWVLPV